jgi:hypothetical protein
MIMAENAYNKNNGPVTLVRSLVIVVESVVKIFPGRWWGIIGDNWRRFGMAVDYMS